MSDISDIVSQVRGHNAEVRGQGTSIADILGSPDVGGVPSSGSPIVDQILAASQRIWQNTVSAANARAGGSDIDALLAAVGADLTQGETPVLEGWMAEMADRGQDRFVTAQGLDLEVMAYDWLTGMSTRQFTEVQRLLYVTGLLQAPQWGRMNPATLQAAQQWLAFAANNLDVDPYSQLLDSAEGLGTMSPDDFASQAALDPDPISVMLDNPADLERIIDQSYRQSLGRRATDDDKRAFVTAFHAFQRRAAEAELRFREQVEGAVESGEDFVEGESPMSAETFIDSYVRAQDPQAYEGEQAVDVANTIRGAI